MGFMELYNSLAGYVTVQAEGNFLERFLNLCIHRDLHIWDIRRCGRERLTAAVSLWDFRSLRPICRRTGTRVKILKRQGFPFFLRRCRNRKFALLGLVLALALLWYASGHIMGITVFGNQQIPTETILEHLARSGVVLGRSSAGIEPAQIRNRMMGDLDQLAWIGINVSGSRVYVEVVERLETAPGVAADQPCSLVAAKDGEILRTEAREGQTMVKKGAGVRAGDVLVSGIVDNAAQGCRYVHAYGEVYAKTRYTLSREYPLTYQEAVDTGNRKTRYTLRVLNARLPLFWGKAQPYPVCAREETCRELRPPIDRLPSLYIQKEVWREQYTRERNRTVAEALELGARELEQELRAGLAAETEVLDRETENTLTPQGGLEVTVTLVCRENIAREAALEPPAYTSPEPETD